MTKLPTGWVNVGLGKIAKKIGSGSTPKGGEQSYKTSGIPLIRSLNVHFDGVRKKGLAYIDTQQAARLDNVIVQEGDVLLNITGASIGRVAVAPLCYDGARVNQHVSIIRLMEGVMPDYVRGFLASPAMQDFINRENYGATRQALTKAMIEGFSVPVPPLAEQKRIVSKLDALKTKSFRARSELSRTQKLIEQFKINTLKCAFEGRLTSRKQVSLDNMPISKSISQKTLWPTPDSWNWYRTDQIGNVGLGRQRSPENHTGSSMRPYIRSANITWQGVNTTDVKEMNFEAADFERFKLVIGDVLLNEGSGSAREVGKPAIWRGEIPDCCYQNTVLRVQPKLCTSEYLYFYFLYTAMTGGFASRSQGVNIQHIGRSGLARYPVPLPPLVEQHEIVNLIKSAFANIEQLSVHVKRTLKLADKLDEAILAKAFRGDLVSQEEDDESASVLLKRMQTNHESMPQKKNGKTKRETVMPTATEFLTIKLKQWPAEGINFQELRKQFPGDYEDLKDAVFAFLSGENPLLQQVFEKTHSAMIIRKSA
ncbi:restriction endonuclease subunit S [Pseudomonas sp. W2Oct36]|uniref:restriction endonuclease subunit S n=1 Tax=Pseudomonas sp. W2Oct36 TaxID=1215284 RepID=UPI0034E0A5AB